MPRNWFESCIFPLFFKWKASSYLSCHLNKQTRNAFFCFCFPNKVFVKKNIKLSALNWWAEEKSGQRLQHSSWWSWFSQKGDWNVCSDYRGVRFLSLPEVVYSRKESSNPSLTLGLGGISVDLYWSWNSEPQTAEAHEMQVHRPRITSILTEVSNQHVQYEKVTLKQLKWSRFHVTVEQMAALALLGDVTNRRGRRKRVFRDHMMLRGSFSDFEGPFFRSSEWTGPGVTEGN